MTAYINKLKDKTGNQQLPVTHERAVRDDNGTTLESKLQNLEGAMDKAYVAQSDNGMGRITLKKNIVSGVNTLTQSMMQATNTIYVIQYDFTLSENITVPANCILEFDGGSVSGSYNLSGNKTKILASLKRIFSDNINVIGTWNIAQWECDWFGAVNDGIIHFSSGQETTYEGTDNWDAIQHALYVAANTNINKVHISYGNFRLSKPLYVGYNVYNNVSLYGSGRAQPAEANVYNKGTVLFFDNAIGGIFVNSCRNSTIANLSIFGKNIRYHSYNVNTLTSQEADWFYTTIEKHNGVDNAAIMYDCIVGNSNYTPFSNRYGIDTPITNYGSHLTIDNVTIKGFYSGIDCQTNTSADGNCDFLTVKHSTIHHCVYGLRNSAYQGRKTKFDYVSFLNIHTCIDNYSGNTNNKYGNTEGEFNLCQFEMVFQIFNISGTSLYFNACGGELIYRLGYTSTSNNNEIVFIKGDYQFGQEENNPIGLLPLIISRGYAPYAVAYDTHFFGNKDNIVINGIDLIGQKRMDAGGYYIMPCVCNYDIKGMPPEFFIDAGGASRHTTVIDGTKIIITLINATAPFIAVGDTVTTMLYGDLFEVISINENVYTLQAKTLIRNGAFRNDAIPNTSIIFNPAGRFNWWKVPARPNGAFKSINSNGTSNTRPERKLITAGFQFYDKTLKKPIWWDGTQWVDATGTPV